MMVIFLTGLVSMILIQKEMSANYAREEDDLEILVSCSIEYARYLKYMVLFILYFFLKNCVAVEVVLLPTCQEVYISEFDIIYAFSNTHGGFKISISL